MDQEVVFIDANLFLEVALKDEKSEVCKNFLQDIINGKVYGCTSNFIPLNGSIP